MGELGLSLGDTGLRDSLNRPGCEPFDECLRPSHEPLIPIPSRRGKAPELPSEVELARTNLIGRMLSIVEQRLRDEVDLARGRADDPEPLVVHPIRGKGDRAGNELSSQHRRRSGDEIATE